MSDASTSEEQTTYDTPAQAQTRGGYGSGWLYLVAALSILNTAIVFFGGEFSLIFGLTSALVAAYIFDAALAIGITVVLAALFGGLGFAVARANQFALIAALVLYLADAAVGAWAVLIVGDSSMLLDLGAHLFVLWGLIQGLRQMRAESADPAAGAFGVPAEQDA